MYLRDRLDWEWRWPAVVCRREPIGLTRRFEKRKYNIGNLQPYGWKKYRPEIKLQISPEQFRNENEFNIFLEGKLRGLPDGQYALRSFAFHLTPTWARLGAGGRWIRWNWRPFRYVYVFTWRNNAITDVQQKSKGKRYGKKEKRPKRYFAMTDYFRLRTLGQV